jgi:hypothetical protein
MRRAPPFFLVALAYFSAVPKYPLNVPGCLGLGVSCPGTGNGANCPNR